MDVLLRSTELREPYEPRRCRLLKRLRSELRDDLALVEVLPPFEPDVYGSPEAFDQLILAARHEGDTIFPVSRWPLRVYICRVDEATTRGEFVPSSSVTILDWGEIVDAPAESLTTPLTQR